MKAISVVPMSTFTGTGKTKVRAVIVSDTAPATLPTTGKGIEGMNESMTFAPFSIIYVVGEAAHKTYIANESGVFVPQ